VLGPAVGAAFQTACLRGLAPDVPIWVYGHIPFCERLCWFCACRIQGARTLSPVESCIETLGAEPALLAAALPQGVQLGRLHWGCGTLAILPPHLIRRLARAIKTVIPPAVAALDAKVTVAAWQTKPSWFIVATKDGSIDPALLRAAQRRRSGPRRPRFKAAMSCF